MIYLLAILWFASGFFGTVYLVTVVDREDFKFPSEDFFIAILLGALAPLAWCFVIENLPKHYPRVTLFKARK